MLFQIPCKTFSLPISVIGRGLRGVEVRGGEVGDVVRMMMKMMTMIIIMEMMRLTVSRRREC